MKIGSTYPPDTMNPAVASNGFDHIYMPYVFDSLINLNPKTGELEPGLATSWKWVGPKKLELDLSLRQGVKFQDGTPFNAQAVVDWYKYWMAQGNTGSQFENVTSATATSEYEVAFHLSEPNAPLPYNLTSWAGEIGSPTAIKKDGKAFATHPVGTGPYTLESQSPGVSYTFKRWDGYWNNAKLPRIEKVKWVIFHTDTALVTALRSGSVDVGYGVYPQDVDSLKSNSSLTVSVSPSQFFNMGYMNANVKPFTDPKVRLAFNLALNRKDLVTVGTNGLGTVWTQPVAKGTLGYSAKEDPVFTYDPKKAKRLLAEAGYPNGVKLKCIVNLDAGFKLIESVMKSELKKVGFDVDMEPLVDSEVTPFFTKNSGPCGFGQWQGSANPAQTYIGILWSKSFYNPGKTNYVDSDIEKLLSSYDTASDQAIYDHINQVMKTNPGYVPLYGIPQVNVYSNKVGGWIPSPYQLNNWQGLYLKG